MFAALLLVLSATPLPKQVLPGPLQAARLSNGIQVALVPFRANGVVAFDVLIRAGARDEGAHGGVAHLVEHALFKGSEQQTEAQFKRALQSLAVDANGETDLDYTLFADVAPMQSLPKLIELEAERLEHPRITNEAIVTEAGAVRSEEIARGANEEADLVQALDAAAFPNHPYGRHPIGSARDVQELQHAADAARSFHAQFYAPDRIAIVVAGEFDAKATLKILERQFGKWSGHSTSDAPKLELPAGEVRTSLRAAEPPPERLLAWRLPASMNAHDEAAAELCAELLARAAPVGARVESQVVARRDAGMLMVSIVARDAAQLGELEESIEARAAQLREGRVDAEWVARARASVLWNAVADLDTPASVARSLAVAAAPLGAVDALSAQFSELAKLDATSLAEFARANLIPVRRAVAGFEGSTP